MTKESNNSNINYNIDFVVRRIPEMLQKGELKEDDLFGEIWENILSYFLNEAKPEGVDLWNEISKEIKEQRRFTPQRLIELDKLIPTVLIPDSLRTAIMNGALS